MAKFGESLVVLVALAACKPLIESEVVDDPCDSLVTVTDTSGNPIVEPNVYAVNTYCPEHAACANDPVECLPGTDANVYRCPNLEAGPTRFIAGAEGYETSLQDVVLSSDGTGTCAASAPQSLSLTLGKEEGL